MCEYYNSNELYHHGVKGMHWGVRRYQNANGSLTSSEKKQNVKNKELTSKQKKIIAGSIIGAAAITTLGIIGVKHINKRLVVKGHEVFQDMIKKESDRLLHPSNLSKKTAFYDDQRALRYLKNQVGKDPVFLGKYGHVSLLQHPDNNLKFHYSLNSIPTKNEIRNIGKKYYKNKISNVNSKHIKTIKKALKK